MQDLESKKWSEECKRLSEKKLARANHVGGTVAATPRSSTGYIRHRASGTGWRVVSPAVAVLLTLLEFSAGTPAGPGKSLKQ